MSNWGARAGRGRRSILKRIVILKGYAIDSIDEYVLRECLKIMFPDCELEIRSTLPESSRDDEADNRPSPNQLASW